MADKALIDMLRGQMADICSSEYLEARSDTGTGCEDSRSIYHASAKNEGSRSAFSRIVKLVNVHDRCTSQLRERLQREDYDEAEVETAIDKAVSCGLVDDLRYAQSLVRSRISQGKGRAGILRELRSLGIDMGDDDVLLDESDCSDDSEFSRALDVLKQNPPRAKNKREAAYRKLVNKGYSSSVAVSAARAWTDMNS